MINHPETAQVHCLQLRVLEPWTRDNVFLFSLLIDYSYLFEFLYLAGTTISVL